MKHFICSFFALSMLLTGCGTSADSETEYDLQGDVFRKTQCITAIDPQSGKTLKTYTSQEEVDDFVQSLKIENWDFEIVSAPENATKACIYQLSQENTVHWGETSSDGELHDVAEMIFYQNSDIVSLQIAGIEIAVSVPEDLANAYAVPWQGS